MKSLKLFDTSYFCIGAESPKSMCGRNSDFAHTSTFRTRAFIAFRRTWAGGTSCLRQPPPSRAAWFGAGCAAFAVGYVHVSFASGKLSCCETHDDCAVIIIRNCIFMFIHIFGEYRMKSILVNTVLCFTLALSLNSCSCQGQPRTVLGGPSDTTIVPPPAEVLRNLIGDTVAISSAHIGFKVHQAP